MMVLPIYIVVDTSESTASILGDFRSALTDMLHGMETDPALNDLVRVSILAFSDSALRLSPLGSLVEIQVPELRASGGTQFGPALRLLRQCLDEDVKRLRGDGLRILRPIAFFMTDGDPTDPDWREAIDALRDDPQGPTMFPIGFGATDPSILRSLAIRNGTPFVIAGTEPGQSARALIEGLRPVVGSVVSSSAIGRDDGLVAPQYDPPGWISIEETAV